MRVLFERVRENVSLRKERPSPPLFAMPDKPSSHTRQATSRDIRASNAALGISLQAASKSSPSLLRKSMNASTTSLGSTETSFSTKESIFSSRTANTSFTTNTSFVSDMAVKDSQETVDDNLTEPLSSWTAGFCDELEQSFGEERPAKRRCSEENRVSPDGPAPPADVFTTPPETLPTEETSKSPTPVAADDTLNQKPDNLLQHQIKNLYKSGFGSYPYPKTPNSIPFAVKVERARLVKHCSLRMERVKDVDTQSKVKDMLAQKPNGAFHHSAPDIWGTDVKNSNLVFSGAIKLNSTSDGPLFQTTIHPIRPDCKSNRVQRHFGYDRIFYASVPSLTKGLPRHISSYKTELAQAFRAWLRSPHVLMGRVWRAFHIQDLKRKAVNGKTVIDDSKTHKIVFFAVRGDGIPTKHELPFNEFIDWMVPMKENINQEMCKAFARFDLMVSTTVKTIEFTPDQVRLGEKNQGCEDVCADGRHEDDAFEDDQDPRFKPMARKGFLKKEVMTDGCSLISVGAALKICESLGISKRPATFQARINGAKGMWTISAPYETSDPHHLAIWIQIRKSQLKVQVRQEDFTEACEKGRWSFDVNSQSHALQPSEVHRDFMPILEDRGVPRSALKELVDRGLREHTTELLQALTNPAALALWRCKHFGYRDKTPQMEDRGLPPSVSERAYVLLERAGYLPTECSILRDAFVRMAELRLQDLRTQIRAPCVTSTHVVGIADPTGTLAPGEVFLILSQPLEDERTSSSFHSFAGKEVLVARHPTLRGSDIQKVRCVYRPELAHLKDVLVMPVHGRIPLAAKLQGGDYDGDKFWICAEESLTKPFRNAPVCAQAGIEKFGITKETSRLCNINEEIGSGKFCNAWLKMAFDFKLQDDLLGQITNQLYKLSYRDRDIWSAAVIDLADMHDLVIDAPKNGYSFDHQTFNRYLREHHYHRGVKRQAYMVNIEDMDLSFEDDRRPKLLDVVRKELNGQNGDIHILDDILFNTINPLVERALARLETALAVTDALRSDYDLEHPLRELEGHPLISATDVNAETKHVLQELHKVYMDHWVAAWNIRGQGQTEKRNEAVRVCFANYDAITPLVEHPYWSMRSAETAPSNWECFRVAVIARHQYVKMSKFLFHVARDTVIYLKSHSQNGRSVLEKIQAIRKPKKPKNMQQETVEYLEASGDGDEDGDEYGAGITDEELGGLDTI